MGASAAAPVHRTQRGLPVAAVFGTLVSLVGLAVVLASGAGFRVGAWSIAAAFRLLELGGWICLAGGLLSLLAAVLTRPGTGRRGFLLSLLGVLLGLGTFVWTIVWQIQRRSAPAINQITTDLNNPPAFATRPPPQAGGPPAPNDSASMKAAAQQRAAYPDLAPAELPVPPGAAFRIALAAARNMGWDITAADSTSGRIEATATTRWFGFTDDIAIRVAASERGGSRVDVRSVSRVGPSDTIDNVRRVREYIAQLERTV